MLDKIKDRKGARADSRAKGRGIGSTKGKTAGRGHKGQKARSGVTLNGFEGGQNPIYRRLPKRGFKSRFGESYTLTLKKLEVFLENGLKLESNDEINLKLLQGQRFVPKKYARLKIVDSSGDSRSFKRGGDRQDTRRRKVEQGNDEGTRSTNFKGFAKNFKVDGVSRSAREKIGKSRW